MLVLSKAVLVTDSSIVPPAGLRDNIELHRNSGQHPDNPMQDRLHRGIVLQVDAIGGKQHVLDCSTFERRTACDVEKLSAIFVAAVAIALGDFQRNRLGNTKPLVAGVTLHSRTVGVLPLTSPSGSA